MNWSDVAARWPSLSEHVQSRWDRITKADLSGIAGNRDALAALLRERYSLDAREAEKSIDEWVAALTRAPLPQQSIQSELDQQRSESEGMGQARYAPPPRSGGTD